MCFTGYGWVSCFNLELPHDKFEMAEKLREYSDDKPVIQHNSEKNV